MLATAGFKDPENHFRELLHTRPFDIEGDPGTFRRFVLCSEAVCHQFATAESLLLRDLYESAETDGSEGYGEEKDEDGGGGGGGSGETWPLAPSRETIQRRKEILSPLPLVEHWKDHLARIPDITYLPFLDLIAEHAAAKLWEVALDQVADGGRLATAGGGNSAAGECGSGTAAGGTIPPADQLPAEADPFRGLSDTTVSAKYGHVFVRCKTWKALEVAVAVLRREYGYNLEFHGTMAAVAKTIARTSVTPGRVPNEFSRDGAIYTAPKVSTAVNRAYTVYGDRLLAVIVFKPEIPSGMQILRLEDDNTTRLFIFNNVRDRETVGIGPYVVIGKTCRNMYGNPPHTIVLRNELQHCYASRRTMAELNERKVPVILEYRMM